MALPIINFSQQAQEQQQRMLDRMRSLCPQTAALGERLVLRPVDLSEVKVGPSQSGGFMNPAQADMDRRMLAADILDAQSSQRLTAVLGQACSQEMLTGEGAVLPAFLRPTR